MKCRCDITGARFCDNCIGGGRADAMERRGPVAKAIPVTAKPVALPARPTELTQPIYFAGISGLDEIGTMVLNGNIIRGLHFGGDGPSIRGLL